MSAQAEEQKYHTLPKASAEAFVALARRRGKGQQADSGLSKSQKIQGGSSSAKWKEHYALVSSKWGAIASGTHLPHHQSSFAWDEIKKQKEKGGYPWTHLSHDQDAEVWIDASKLPRDITTATLKRKDQSIPREWFHLPKGAEPPTVDDLMRDSSPEVEPRAISPPICGRSRSKERRPFKFGAKAGKHFIDDGGYEPVGKERDETDNRSRPVSIKPLNLGSSSMSKTKTVGGSKASIESVKQALPPRKAFTALPDPPAVNRDTKPVSPVNIQGVSKGWQPQHQNGGTDDGGYEPIGLERSGKRDYEDVQFKSGGASKEIPEYAKIDKSKKVSEKKEDEKEKKLAEKERKNKEKAEKEKKDKEEKEKKMKDKQREKLEKEAKEKEEKARKLKEKQEKEQREKEEKERKLKEKEQKDKAEKEKKLKEKQEKEQKDAKEKEEKARKIREKQEKEQQEKEEKARKLKEKQEKDQLEKEEKERKLKEKLEKEQYEKEERERKLREKEQKEKEEKERKLKEKQEKEQRDKDEKDEKEKKLRLPSDFIKPQPSSIAGKTPDSSQFGTAQASVFQHDQAFETHQVRVTTPVQVQQDFSTALSHHDEQPSQSHEIHDQSFPETDEFDQFFKATGPSFSQFSDNLNQQYSDDFNQQYSDNFNPMPVMEEPPMFVEDYGPPLTEKERKKKEKELKKEREKEEKERKKREKEEKKQEKEEQEKLKKLKEKEKKEQEKNKNAKGLLDIAKEKSIEQKAFFQTPLSNGVEETLNGEDPKKVENEQNDLDMENDFEAQFFVKTEELSVQPVDQSMLLEESKELSSKKKGKNKDFAMPSIKMPEVHMPKVDMKAKLHDMNESIKNTKMPTSQEIKDGYLNSNFHKSFHQQLAVSSKVLEDQDVAKSRQELVKNKSPTELAQMKHPFDIPLPKIKFSVKSKPSDDNEAETKSLNINDLDENKSRMFQTLTKSLKEQNLLSTGTKVMEDQEEAKSRQELVKTKNPAQLAEFHSIKDIPIPSKVKSILSPSERKIMAQKQQNQRKSSTASASSSPKESFNLSLPKSWKETKLVTQTRDDLDIEEAKRRREIVQTKSPKELAQFHGFDDIPVPSKVTTLFKTELKKPDFRNIKRSKSETSIKSASKASSWKDQKLVTKVKVEEINDEIELRRALASKKSPAELSQITSLQDIPVPTTLKRMMKTEKKPLGEEPQPQMKFSTLLKNKLSRSLSNIDEKSNSNWMTAECVVRKRVEDPMIQAQRAETVKTKTVAELSQIHSLSDLPIPSALQHLTEKRPKRMEVHQVQDYVPQSLKSTLKVSSKYEADPEILRERMELNRSKSPTELSEIHSLSDVPIPKMFRSPTSSRPVSPISQPEQSNWSGDMYNTLSKSMKSELLVRSKIEDPEIQKQRAECVKAKSVGELSQINTIDDIPLPRTIENLVGRSTTSSGRPVERKKKFREMTRNLSSKSLQEKLVPENLTSQKILVVSKFEDPEILKERQAAVHNKSVSELSQISSFSDFPLPTKIEKLLPSSKENESPSKLKRSKSGDAIAKPKDYSHLSPMAIHDTIYSTLPRSMKSELKVRVKQYDNPDDLRDRKELVGNKSPAELAEMRGLSDLPIPSPIQNFWQGVKTSKLDVPDFDKLSQCTGFTGKSSLIAHYDIYGTLPSSLKKEVLVRSRADGDYDTLQKRRALVEAKSPAELSQITNFSEIPLPSRIEEWLHSSHDRPLGETTMIRHPRNKSPSNMLPGLPDTLKRQCLVRSRTEEPEVLKERKLLTQQSSPHELSKIRNLNELPLPVKRLQLPDIPLPSVKYLIKPPTRGRRVDEACQTVESSFDAFTPASTPRLLEGAFSDDEALRFEMSSPESLPRDTDFGYEIIEEDKKKTRGNQMDEDASSISVAEHYRGTPPLKVKKKKIPHKSDKSPGEPATSDDEAPPPLPPKKSQLRETSVDNSSYHSLALDNDSIQSRPLPTPPTKKKLVEDDDEVTLEHTEVFHSLRSEKSTTLRLNEESVEEKFHSLRSSLTMINDPQHDDHANDETLAESIIDSMHTCLDTLNEGADKDDNTMNDDNNDSGDEFVEEMLPLDPTKTDQSTPTPPAS